MCLVTNHNEPKIANRDILVYKVVQPYKIRGITMLYKTPYVESQLSCTPEEDFVDIKKMPSYETDEQGYIHYVDSRYLIGSGVIHAYTSSMEIYNNILFDKRHQKVITGIIPKGTKYWVSYNGAEIAAKEIIFPKKYLKTSFLYKWVKKLGLE